MMTVSVSAGGQAVANCPPILIFDCLQQDILSTAEFWLDRSLDIVADVFAVLLVLEIIVTGYSLWMKQGSASDILQHLAFKLVVMAAILAGFTWVASENLGIAPLIIPQEWATDIAPDRTSVTTPTGPAGIVTSIIAIGLKLYAEMVAFVDAETPLSWWEAIANFGIYYAIPALLMLTALLVVGTFIRLATLVLQVLIEGYIVMGAGAVFLGFMAFRGTAPLSEGWLRYMVHVCIKFFFVLVLCAMASRLGQDMVIAWQSSTAWFLDINDVHAGPLVPVLGMAAMCMIMWRLFKLPESIAQKITQNLTINIKGWLSKT